MSVQTCSVEGCGGKHYGGQGFCSKHHRRWKVHGSPYVNKRSDRRTISDRFWSKVDKTASCWNWIGAIGSTGYGHIAEGGKDGKTLTASRASWEIHYGKIAGDLFVLHKCDNPRCVRPDHLFLGTNKENMHDMLGKGRGKLKRGTGSGEHCPTRKLTWVEVCQIRDLAAAGKVQRWIASEYKVDPMTISNIVRFKCWKTKGEKFEGVI